MDTHQLFEHAKSGNADVFADVVMSGDVLKNVILIAASYGHVNVLEVCVDRYYWGRKSTLCGRVCKKAAKYGHIPVIEFVIRMIGLSNVITMHSYDIHHSSIKYDQHHIIEWLTGILLSRHSEKEHEKNMIDDRLNIAMSYAVEYGKADTIKKLWSMGVRTRVDYFNFHRSVGDPERSKVMVVLHELKILGKFRNRCLYRNCMPCKIEKVWDMWVMESQEFESVSQWLPKEVLADVLDFTLLTI